MLPSSKGWVEDSSTRQGNGHCAVLGMRPATSTALGSQLVQISLPAIPLLGSPCDSRHI